MQTRTIQELIVNQKLITIHQTARVRWAAKVMTRHTISALPVMKEGFVIGIVTERDIVQKCLAAGLMPCDATMRDIMTPDPLTIRFSETVSVAIAKMLEHNIRHLPVQCVDGSVCGMVSMRMLVADMKKTIQASIFNIPLYGPETMKHLVKKIRLN